LLGNFDKKQELAGLTFELAFGGTQEETQHL
jgi:hypothetical protein